MISLSLSMAPPKMLKVNWIDANWESIDREHPVLSVVHLNQSCFNKVWAFHTLQRVIVTYLSFKSSQSNYLVFPAQNVIVIQISNRVVMLSGSSSLFLCYFAIYPQRLRFITEYVRRYRTTQRGCLLVDQYTSLNKPLFFKGRSMATVPYLHLWITNKYF